MKTNINVDIERKTIEILFWDTCSKQSEKFIKGLDNLVRNFSEVNLWCMYDQQLKVIDIFGCSFENESWSREQKDRIWKKLAIKVRLFCQPFSDDSSDDSDYDLPPGVRFMIENR